MNFSPVNRKALALLVLVFALGIGLGAVGTVVMNQRVYSARAQGPQAGPGRQGGGPGGRGPQRDPAARRAQAVEHMAHDLNLSADQQQQVSHIFADQQAQYDALGKQMDPQFDKIRDDNRNRIRKLLDPDQLTKYNDFMKRVDEERRQRNDNH